LTPGEDRPVPATVTLSRSAASTLMKVCPAGRPQQAESCARHTEHLIRGLRRQGIVYRTGEGDLGYRRHLGAQLQALPSAAIFTPPARYVQHERSEFTGALPPA
jgi:hypothetical protein